MSIPASQKASYVNAISDTPDGIIYGDIESPQITGLEDIIVNNRYSGVNFLDAYFRKGVYPGTFPLIFGSESAGVVAAIGDKVKDYKVGDKVAFLGPKAFAEFTKITESTIQVTKLPDSTTDEQLKLWSAALAQCLTAITFAHEAYEVKKGDFILVWAAAGGVGQILTQYIANLGAHVIATASSDEKLAIAKLLGAEYVIKLSDDVVAKVKEITGGKGVAASFDGLGREIFDASLESLAKKGTLVTYGNATGLVPPFSVNFLSAKNIKVVCPSLFGYLGTKEEWNHYIEILKKALEDNVLKLEIATYPLSEYKEATIALEGRKTTGKLVLEIPKSNL